MDFKYTYFKLSKDTIQEYITFFGGIIKVNVIDINKNEEPFNLVQYIKFTHSQNHVGNIMIIVDISLESFSQIEE